MTSSERSTRSSILHRWWVRALLILLLLCLLVILVFPIAAKFGLRTWLLKNGADKAEVASITYNPFAFRLHIEGLNVEVGGRTLLSNGSMLLDLGPGGLFHKDIHVQQSTYEKLKIDIEQKADGSWRFGSYSLMNGGSDKSQPASEEKAMPQEATDAVSWIFSADNIALNDCVISFKTPDLHYDLAVKRAELANFSTAKDDGNGRFQLDGTLNGKNIKLLLDSLKVAPSLALSGTARVDGFDLGSLQKLLADALPIFAGVTSLDGKLKFALGEDGSMSSGFDGKITLVAPAVGSDGYKVVSERITWSGKVGYNSTANGTSKVSTDGTLASAPLALSLPETNFTVKSDTIAIAGTTRVGIGKDVVVDNTGKLSLETIALDMEGLNMTLGQFAWDGKVGFDGGKQSVSTAGNLTGSSYTLNMPESEFALVLASVSLTGDTSVGYGSEVQVKSTSRLDVAGAKIDMAELNLAEERLSWDGNVGYTGAETLLLDLDGAMQSGPFTFAKGEMSAGYGRFDIGKIQGQLKNSLHLADVSSDTLQVKLPGEMPLTIVAEHLAVPNIDTDDFQGWQVTGTEVSNISGTSQVNDEKLFDLASAKIGSVTAQAKGETRIETIVLSGMDFLAGQFKGGKSVGTIKGVEVSDIGFTQESGVMVHSLDVEGLHVNVVRDKKGNININTLLAGMKRPGPEAEQKSEQADTVEKVPAASSGVQSQPGIGFKLETFRLSEKSRVDFTDYTLPLPFITDITVKDMTLIGLDSTAPDKRAKLNFEGELEKRAPLAIKGDLAPFSEKPAMQFIIDLKNYPLERLSPYTVQAVGTALASGMLKIHSTMGLENDRLDLENHVELKKLETKTISPELAAELNNQLPIPLDAALSVLRDSERNIKLDIPLKGPLDDLSVGVSDVIITALGKAIIPAASSYLVYALGPYGALAYVGFKAGEKMLQVSLPPVVYEVGAVAVPSGLDDYLQRVANILADRPKTDLSLCPQVLATELAGEEVAAGGIQASVTATQAEAAGDVEQVAPMTGDNGTEGAVNNNEQLLQLGQDRAQALKDYLMEKFAVAADRLLICETAIITEKKAQPSVLLNL